MRQYLAIAGLVLAGLTLLCGVAAWLDGNGYARARVECALEASKQAGEIAGLRRQIEEGWRDAGDRIADQRKELDDAVAEFSAVDSGDAVCIPAERVRELDALRRGAH